MIQFIYMKLCLVHINNVCNKMRFKCKQFLGVIVEGKIPIRLVNTKETNISLFKEIKVGTGI